MTLLAFRRMSDGSHPPAAADADHVIFFRPDAGHWHIRGRHGLAGGTASPEDLVDLEAWASRTALAHAEMARSMWSEGDAA
ncbi:hypothetical protein [Aureimonas glaciei]|uniref:Uncharacterized protein n=1 Tax=Aureimonas glaciei TaxID=1776957 RepID=A0A917DJ44_9HYPH|nr:hypothetical protein [Aureimonas glaciei]GGD43944.1 hypothetical protein GCM10011335_53210 [Aureimonas glaciei]